MWNNFVDWFKLGGTTDFFSDASSAARWAETYIIEAYPNITETQRVTLMEKSESVEMTVWEELNKEWYLSDADRAMGAYLYWSVMTKYIEKTENQGLINVWNGNVQVSAETVDYEDKGVVRWDYFVEAVKEDLQGKAFSLPWYVWAGAGLILFVSLRR